MSVHRSVGTGMLPAQSVRAGFAANPSQETNGKGMDPRWRYAVAGTGTRAGA
jgi:hypothetical protein